MHAVRISEWMTRTSARTIMHAGEGTRTTVRLIRISEAMPFLRRELPSILVYNIALSSISTRLR